MDDGKFIRTVFQRCGCVCVYINTRTQLVQRGLISTDYLKERALLLLTHTVLSREVPKSDGKSEARVPGGEARASGMLVRREDIAVQIQESPKKTRGSRRQKYQDQVFKISGCLDGRMFFPWNPQDVFCVPMKGCRVSEMNFQLF